MKQVGARATRKWFGPQCSRAISRLGVIRCAVDLQRLQRRHAIRGRSQSVVKQSPLLEPACAIVACQ